MKPIMNETIQQSWAIVMMKVSLCSWPQLEFKVHCNGSSTERTQNSTHAYTYGN